MVKMVVEGEEETEMEETVEGLTNISHLKCFHCRSINSLSPTKKGTADDGTSSLQEMNYLVIDLACFEKRGPQEYIDLLLKIDSLGFGG